MRSRNCGIPPTNEKVPSVSPSSRYRAFSRSKRRNTASTISPFLMRTSPAPAGVLIDKVPLRRFMATMEVLAELWPETAELASQLKPAGVAPPVPALETLRSLLGTR